MAAYTRAPDGGANWSAVNTGLTNTYVEALAIDPSNTSIVYTGTLGGVYKSTNGGANWSATCFGGAGEAVIDPANTSTVYVGTWGLSRARMEEEAVPFFSSMSVAALAIDPANTSTIYAGTNDGVYKSTDGGANWSAVNTGLTNLYVQALAIDPTNTSIVYAGVFTYGVPGGGVYKSTDGGANWSAVIPGLL